ncbi:MAG: hypothetical protein AAF361_09595 [Bacteroidota bacterium]
MDSQHNVLLVTTTQRAIKLHLPEVIGHASSHWLISPDQRLPLTEIDQFTPSRDFLVLLDEFDTLSFEEEEALCRLFEERIIFWIWHKEHDVIDLPHKRFFKQHEHSETGTVAELFFLWRNTTYAAERSQILRRHFSMSRRQALETYKRTYLNIFTCEQLAETGQKYLQQEELNYAEKQLLEAYPQIGEELSAFIHADIPERMHYQRLKLAEFLYAETE